MNNIGENSEPIHPQLTAIDFLGVRIVAEPEAKLKDYLGASIRRAHLLKIAPVTMKEIMNIFFSPSVRRHYRKLDLVYPDSGFSCRCLSNFNRDFQGEKRIYSHRLLLDLIENTFSEKRPLTFVGLNEDQKNHLHRKLKFLFPQPGDICFLHPQMVRHQPEETLTWLNRSHYGLVISQAFFHSFFPSSRKLRDLLLNRLQQGLLFFDNGQLDRYRKDWRKKPAWYTFRGLGILFTRLFKIFFITCKILGGLLFLYYPGKIFFSLCFWVFSFIINKSKKRFTITINSLSGNR